MKNRVKELREQYGLTQAQLGEKVKVSRQAINAIENRTRVSWYGCFFGCLKSLGIIKPDVFAQYIFPKRYAL